VRSSGLPSLLRNSRYATGASTTGLRAGEAMRIEIDKYISADFKTLYIQQKIRRAKLESFLKTNAGRREVDRCPVLASMLKGFVGERTSGFLFQNRRGKYLLPDKSFETWTTPSPQKVGSAQGRVSRLLTNARHSWRTRV
jgi:hypothetical protein